MTVVRKELEERAVPSKRLGRHVAHDSRSKNYPAPMADTVQSVVHVVRGLPLDQGDVGSCTGNACVGMLMSEPFVNHTTQEVGGRDLNEQDALRLYSEATHVDGYRGLYPPTDTGSSGLAVCKAATKERFLQGYYWSFGLDHALRTLVLQPVITGVSWYDGFDHPDSNGVVRVSGSVRGGHEFLLYGIDVEAKLIIAMNSWGPSWGQGGTFKIPFEDFDRLLHEQGDVKTGAVYA